MFEWRWKNQSKTDNRGSVESSLCSMNEFGMHFDGVWLDLHDSEEAKENVMTEYEEKFSQKVNLFINDGAFLIKAGRRNVVNHFKIEQF